MVELEGRVAVVTGAGRGLGREHALFLASHGVKVIVNDRGVDTKGHGEDQGPAHRVVAEIAEAGGTAAVSTDDIATWDGARDLVERALDEYGDLDIVVNNAGILRDRTIIKMTEDDFDDVIEVHLKGHFVVTRFAAIYWRQRAKDGERRPRNLVHTSSTSGIFANPGQANYGPAKSGIVTFSQIAAAELGRYGVVSNCVLPGARTRLTLSSPGLPEIMEAPGDGFDQWDPANVSPVVAYLAGATCPFTGQTFYVQGGTVRRLKPWTLLGESIERPQRWTLDQLDTAMERFRPS
ncbi:MAG: short-chain dehydrogenase [Ilumatobacter coccineus]|uniref:Short-chain dehydrogenase n=1 Tax=Ilumatobacter coccineus TaxID=467094 RepID=A0A2G6KEK0_9ACTN|nr:MAG: short-chain dehydrogenase [Ilumatobacter coccineus]